MTKVLVVEDNDDLCLLIEAELEGLCENLEVVIKTSLATGLEAIQEAEFDLVISDYNLGDGEGGEIYEYFRSLTANQSRPFIFLTTEEYDFLNSKHGFGSNQHDFYYSKERTLDKFHDYLLEVLHFSENDLCPMVRIKQSVFWFYSKTSVDIHLKLSEGKWIKILNAGDSYEWAQLEKYVKKGIDYFYLSREDFKKVKKDFFGDSFLARFDQVSEEDPIKGEALLIDLIQRLGISENSIQVAHRLTDRILKDFKTEKESGLVVLKMLLNAREQFSFIYQHSLITASLVAQIGTDIEAINVRQRDKVITAALIHDTGFSKADSNRELSGSDHQHLTKLAQLLKSTSLGDCTDTLKIIELHHELPNGAGYPRGLHAEQIATLPAIFITAHEFTCLFFKANFDILALSKILNEMENAGFTRGSFKKPFENLKSIFPIKFS